MSGKFKAASAQMRRDSHNATEGMKADFTRVGEHIKATLERTFSIHHLVKGMLMGIGAGSVEKLKELIVEPWKQAAEQAERLQRASEEAVKAQRASLLDRRQDWSEEKQRAAAKKDNIEAGKRFDEALKRVNANNELMNWLMAHPNPSNLIEAGMTGFYGREEEDLKDLTDARAELEESEKRLREMDRKAASEKKKEDTTAANEAARMAEEQAKEKARAEAELAKEKEREHADEMRAIAAREKLIDRTRDMIFRLQHDRYDSAITTGMDIGGHHLAAARHQGDALNRVAAGLERLISQGGLAGYAE
jgi:membrane protein involved in colicin uptake